MKDFYAILGVSPTADEATLKSAYRKLAKEFHPDTNKSQGAEARFKEIGEAYDTLKDPHKRAAYDRERVRPQPASSSTGPYGWTRHPNPGGRGADIDLDEILRDIRRSRNPFPEDARNRDIVLSYAITLEEAFTGKEAEVTYNLPGKEPQKINFKVPSGIQEGIKLRFQGKGDDSMKHVAPGDLYIKIAIIPHHTFIRMGHHLATSITIDYFDAMLGTEKEISTIDGGKIKMKVPAGILPGQSLRAAGKGMPLGGTRGDMMIEIVFESTRLTQDQKDLIEQARAKKAP
jgi:curved DNA-binding protein